MASPGSSRLSALHTAAARGNLAAMRLVLEHGSIRDAEDGIDARSTDTNGDTVLHVAAAHSRWPVVSWLVANGGGDPDIRNVAGHTALESVPTAEGKDVYVAILGRAVSPRAKRTARRIAASPETTNWKELQTTTNAENSGVPEKQPPPPGSNRESVSPSAASKPLEEQTLQGYPSANLEQTLRFDLHEARRSLRDFGSDVSGTPRESETRYSPVTKTQVVRRHPGERDVPETPGTMRKVLRHLDRRARAIETDFDESVSFGDRSDGDDDDGGDGVSAFVPKSLLRRAAVEVRRVNCEFKKERLDRIRTEEALAVLKETNHSWEVRALAAESAINTASYEKVSVSLALAQVTGEKDSVVKQLELRNCELRELRVSCDKQSQSTTTCESENSRLTAQLERALKNAKNEHELRCELEVALDTCETQLADERGARRDAQTVSSSKAMDADDALAEVTASKRREEVLTSRAVEAERAGAVCQGRLEETRKALRDAETVIRELRVDLGESKSVSEIATGTAATATTQCEGLLTQHKTLLVKLQNAEREREETKNALASLTETFLTTKTSNEKQSQAAQADAKAQANRANQELVRARVDRDAYCAESAESRVTIVELESNLKQLKETNESKLSRLTETNQALIDQTKGVLQKRGADEEARRVLALAKIGRRWRNNTIAAAFGKWVETVDETKRVRVAMRRVVTKFARRVETAAFAKWRHEAASAKRKREDEKASKAKTKKLAETKKNKAESETALHERLLKRAVAKIFGNRRTKCFHKWRGLVETKKRELAFGQKVGKKLNSLRLKGAWNDWLLVLDCEKHETQIVENATRRNLIAHARRMLVRWCDTTRARDLMRRRMKVVVGKFRFREKQSAFVQWSANVYDSTVRKRVADRALKRCDEKRLRKYWVWFSCAAQQQRRENVFVARAISRRNKQTVFAALVAWVMTTQDEHARRVATGRFLAKRKRRVTQSVLKEWHVELVREKKLAVAACRVEKALTRRKLVSAFDTWTCETLELKATRVIREKQKTLLELTSPKHHQNPVSPNAPRGLSLQGSSPGVTRSRKSFGAGQTRESQGLQGGELTLSQSGGTHLEPVACAAELSCPSDFSDSSFSAKDTRLARIGDFLAATRRRYLKRSFFSQWRVETHKHALCAAKENVKEQELEATRVLTEELEEVKSERGVVLARVTILENELISEKANVASLKSFAETSKQQIQRAKVSVAENKTLLAQLATCETARKTAEIAFRGVAVEVSKHKRFVEGFRKEKKELKMETKKVSQEKEVLSSSLKTLETQRRALEAHLSEATEKIVSIKLAKQASAKKHAQKVAIVVAANGAMKSEIATLREDVLSSNARADHLNERVVFLEAGLGRARDAAQIAERAFEATRKEQAVAWEDDLRRLVAEAKEATEQQSNAVLRSSEQNLLEKTRAVALLEKQAAATNDEALVSLQKITSLETELAQVTAERDALVVTGFVTPPGCDIQNDEELMTRKFSELPQNDFHETDDSVDFVSGSPAVPSSPNATGSVSWDGPLSVRTPGGNALHGALHGTEIGTPFPFKASLSQGTSSFKASPSPTSSFKQSSRSNEISALREELALAKIALSECDAKLDTATRESDELRPELTAKSLRCVELEVTLAATDASLCDSQTRCVALQATLDESKETFRGRISEKESQISEQQRAAKVAADKSTSLLLAEFRNAEKTNATEAAYEAASSQLVELEQERKTNTMERDVLKETLTGLEAELTLVKLESAAVKQALAEVTARSETEIALASKAKESAAAARAKETATRRSKETDLATIKSTEKELAVLRLAFHKTSKHAAAASAAAAKLRVRERDLLKKAETANEAERAKDEASKKKEQANKGYATMMGTPKSGGSRVYTPLSSNARRVDTNTSRNINSTARVGTNTSRNDSRRVAHQLEQRAYEAENAAAAAADAAEAAELLCSVIQAESTRVKEGAKLVVAAAEEIAGAAETRERSATQRADRLEKQLERYASRDGAGRRVFEKKNKDPIADSTRTSYSDEPLEDGQRGDLGLEGEVVDFKRKVSPPQSPKDDSSPMRKTTRLSRLQATLEESKTLGDGDATE